ncbi:hypothetical protein E2C01_081060 [Portunus trituberculatus]|uniref:Uncharacterized protein n=1 Tax=Portunus trituberculatus TaxID=210409 RepID=A0A5B7J021_PORTR|nr:hypothetical protein [Portunus trituberculatus]
MWGCRTCVLIVAGTDTSRYDSVCRFCSKDCGEKIKNGEKIPLKCCNCGQNHNPGSVKCEKRPSLLDQLKKTTPQSFTQFVFAESPTRNAWFPLQREHVEVTTVAKFTYGTETVDAAWSSGYAVAGAARGVAAVEDLQLSTTDAKCQLPDLSASEVCE